MSERSARMILLPDVNHHRPARVFVAYVHASTLFRSGVPIIHIGSQGFSWHHKCQGGSLSAPITRRFWDSSSRKPN